MSNESLKIHQIDLEQPWADTVSAKTTVCNPAVDRTGAYVRIRGACGGRDKFLRPGDCACHRCPFLGSRTPSGRAGTWNGGAPLRAAGRFPNAGAVSDGVLPDRAPSGLSNRDPGAAGPQTRRTIPGGTAPKVHQRHSASQVHGDRLARQWHEITKPRQKPGLTCINVGGRYWD